jgi:hypothetical protein
MNVLYKWKIQYNSKIMQVLSIIMELASFVSLTLSPTALLPPPELTALGPIGSGKEPVLMTSARSIGPRAVC